MAKIAFFLCLVLCIERSWAVPTVSLEATPREIIPGLTPSLGLTCSPGAVAHEYRQVYFIQILADVAGTPTPLATLQPDRAPEVGVSNLRLTAEGQLGTGVRPNNASLTVTVDTPLAGGTITCKIEGLGANGNEVTYADSINVTEHPQSSVVHVVLKELVLRLRREAEALLAQTLALQQANQRLSLLTAAKRAALSEKEAALRLLREQVAASRSSVEAQEAHLNLTAPVLEAQVANISAHAPPTRVAFNAVERTERTYPAGSQILLETVLLNEGDGYNTTTSIFHPPVAGVYYITSAQLAHDHAGASYRSYSIRRNTTIMSSAYSGDDYQSSRYQHSSTGVVMALTPHDTVTVIEQYGTTATTQLAAYGYTPDGLSTNFAGYILY